ncbi:MAG: hypothetical protein J6V23_07070 [Bacteroidaceae bacterium]|nr:hypothetical protein [Bacteroidaceae bacterium]
MIHTNPSEELVRSAGYKDLHEDEQPDYDIETHYLERVYEDSDKGILVHWEVKEIESVADNEN